MPRPGFELMHVSRAAPTLDLLKDAILSELPRQGDQKDIYESGTVWRVLVWSHLRNNFSFRQQLFFLRQKKKNSSKRNRWRIFFGFLIESVGNPKRVSPEQLSPKLNRDHPIQEMAPTAFRSNVTELLRWKMFSVTETRGLPLIWRYLNRWFVRQPV